MQAFIPQHKEMGRLLRYLVAGAGGTVLDFFILTLLKLGGWPTLTASTLGFVTGLIHNYTWNRFWTFGDSRHGQWHIQFLQFAFVSLIGLGLNNGLVLWLEGPFSAWLGQPSWGYLPAKVVATVFVVVWNFSVNRFWTFRDAKLEGEQS